MKKLIFGLFLFLAIQTVCFTAYGAVSLGITDKSARITETVDLTLNVGENSRLGAATIVISYETGFVDLLSAEKPSSMPGIIDINNKIPGQIKLSYINQYGLITGGSILNMKFKVKSDAEDAVPLSVKVTEFVSSDYETIQYSVSEGKIIVADGMPWRKLDALTANDVSTKESHGLRIMFNTEITKASATEHIKIKKKSDLSQAINTMTVISEKIVYIRPIGGFAANTQYVLEIGGGVTAVGGGALGGTAIYEFTTGSNPSQMITLDSASGGGEV